MLLGFWQTSKSSARAVRRYQAALLLPQGVPFRKRFGIGDIKCGAAQLTCAKCSIKRQAINEIAATDVY